MCVCVSRVCVCMCVCMRTKVRDIYDANLWHQMGAPGMGMQPYYCTNQEMIEEQNLLNFPCRMRGCKRANGCVFSVNWRRRNGAIQTTDILPN